MKRVLFACLSLIAIISSGSAQTNFISVLQTGPAVIVVDTVILDLITGFPLTVPTPDFGGSAAVEDTFDFGPQPGVTGVTVCWLLDGRRQRAWVIEQLREDRWYEFPLFDTDTARIKFLRPGAVREGCVPQPAPTALISPCPFQDRVTIRLAGSGLIPVRDASGRIVRFLTPVSPSEYVWDGSDATGRRLRPGVYFLHTAAGSYKLIRQ